MGNGNIVNSESRSIDKWDYVVPDSLGAINLESLCSYKP
jgi:hypothetical protein